MNERTHTENYVLMTAAHNEGAFIEETIKSVLAQSVRPARWAIVSDGSTDKTDEIVEAYARGNEFIRFLKLARPAGRSYGSKGHALNNATKLLEGALFQFIGNLDADITLEPNYYEMLMARFDLDPQLGLVSGLICERRGGTFEGRASNRIDSVSHAAQLLRHECYRAIGGYSILKYGGEDWYAQQCAKMNGWTAYTIPSLKVFHHRNTGTSNRAFRRQFRAGRVDHSMGSDPVFELLKCGVRVRETPWVLGAMTRFLGFLWSTICREPRPVSREFVQFLRKEQRTKILGLFNGTGRRRLPGAQDS